MAIRSWHCGRLELPSPIFFSDKVALYSSGAQPVVAGNSSLALYDGDGTGSAAKANIPVPKLYVVPEAAPNAFATGRQSRVTASVAVTAGGSWN